MKSVARFALKLLRLGADTSAAVASNLGASAFDRRESITGSVCVAIAATFTAVKSTAEYYLNAEDTGQAEGALISLIQQHGNMPKALQKLANGEAQTEILSPSRARELLDLLDKDTDDPTDLTARQNEILFEIVRWLEKWQASHEQEANLLSAAIAKRFDEHDVALGRIEAAADTANQNNLTAHALTQAKIDSLPDVLAKRILAPHQSDVSETALREYLSWVTSTTESFVVPGLGVSIPINSAWAKLKAIKSSSRGEQEIGTLAAEVARYHEWERLSSSHNGNSVEAEHLTFLSRLIVIVGGPGAGKSTLLRRLAYRFAGIERLVVRIRLSLVAQRMRTSSETFDDALAAAAGESSPLSNIEIRRLLDEAEFLLADGLDETDPIRVRVAQQLTAWAVSHPDTRVVVTTRPVGHDPGLFPGWQHAELLPFDLSSIRTHATALMDARFPDDQLRAYREAGKFEERVEKNAVASLAARNPLLLGFLVRLSLNDVDFGESRSALFQQIIELMLHTELAERVSPTRLDDPVAWCCLELIGALLQENPGMPKIALCNAVGDMLAVELRESPLGARTLATRAINLWEAQHVLETITSGTHQTVTFIHLSLQEFAAARFAAGLPKGELKNWIQRVHGLPKYREVLLLAAGSGAGDEVIRNLLELDSVGDPVSQVPALAAAALNEYSRHAADVERDVANHLLRRLSSDIPLVAYESAQSLVGLATQMPGFVGPLTLEFQRDPRPWVRLAALAVAVHAGKAFVNPDSLLEAYPELGGAVGFSKSSGSADWDTEEGKSLERAMIGPATEVLLEIYPQQDALQAVEKKLFDGRVSAGSVGDICAVLTQKGHAQIVEQYNKQWSERFADLDFRRERTAKAAETFLVSLIAAAGLTPADVRAANNTDFATVGAVASAISLMHAPFYEYTNLGNGSGCIDAAMANVLKGAIAALDLQPALVASEAKAAIQHIARGGGELGCYPNVPTEPKWSNAGKIGLDIPLLASALDHPSRLIVFGAANLLEAGVGGTEAAKAVEAGMSKYSERGLCAVSHIAEALWGKRSIDVLLERLGGELTDGCGHLLLRLPDLCDDPHRDQAVKSLVRGLKAQSADVAKRAARAFLQADFANVAQAELREALAYWKVHESPCPVGDGIIPSSPREDLVKALVVKRLLSLDELIELSKDVRSDVRKAATNGVKQQAEESLECLREVLDAIDCGLLPLTLLPELAASAKGLFAQAQSEVLKFLQSDSAYKRVAALEALSHPWIGSSLAIELASMQLTDTNPSVRDQAVRTLRLLQPQR